MAAPMVRTKHPGIYKRGSRYVVRYRADGKHRTESARTLDDARRLLSKRRTEVDGGEYRTPTRETLAEYARRWIDAYQGSGTGFRERTREDYGCWLDTDRTSPVMYEEYSLARKTMTCAISPVSAGRFNASRPLSGARNSGV